MADKKSNSKKSLETAPKSKLKKTPAAKKQPSKNILQFETLISGFSASLTSTHEENLENELNRWLERFVNFLKVDRCIVNEFMEDGKTVRRLLNYTVPDIDLAPVLESYRPPVTALEDLKKGLLIKAEKIPEDLPLNFRGGIIDQTGTKSIVIAPLAAGDNVIGTLLFASYTKRRKWSDGIIRRIKLIGEIIANAILRIRSHKSLFREMERGKMLEERYTAILKNANVGFFLSDYENNIIFVNDEYCRMSGYSRDELYLKTIYDLQVRMNPDEEKRVADELMTKGATHHEATHKKKDGSRIDLDVSSTVLDENTFFSFMRDITELNQARREREERLRFEEVLSEFSAALMKAKPDDVNKELDKWLEQFVYILDVDRGIINEYLDNHEKIKVLIQYTLPEVDVPLAGIRKTPEGVMGELKKGVLRAQKIPEDLPEVFYGTHVTRHRTKSIVVVPLISESEIIGNLTFVSYRKERQWPDDLIVRIKIIGEIIANAILRKRSSDALHEEMRSRSMLEEKYSSIIKHASVGFVLSDHDQNILDVNDEYCRMSGYSHDELVTMRIADLDYSEDPENKVRQDGVLTVGDEEGLFQHETRHIHKSGRIFDVDVSTQYLESEGVFFSFLRDVTELNRARRELEKRLKFEELTSEFSAALMNIKLDDLFKELEKWIIRFVDFLGVDRGVVNEYDYGKNATKALVNYTDPAAVVLTCPHDTELETPDPVMEELRKGTIIRAEKIPEDLKTQFQGWIIEKHNIKSLVVVPLISESEIIGNLTFASYRKERKWPDDVLSRIKLIGEIIANAILRFRAYKALNKAQKELEERLEFEEVISAFSTALINIKPDDIKNELGKWLNKFVDFFGADRCAVNEYGDDQKIIKNLMQYSVPEVDIRVPDVRKTPEGEIDELKKGIISVENISEDLPRMFHGSFVERSKVKSLVIVPLLTGNRIFGNLAFTNYRKERKWADEIIRRIKLIAEIVGNAILRLRAHEALVEEMTRRHMLEERYSSIIETANVGFIISDLHANIVEVNDAYCEMTGYSRDELTSMKINQLDISVDPEDIEKRKDDIFKAGELEKETTTIRKDGIVLNVLISANLLENEGMICSFVRDVTELKIARKDLEERLEFEALTSEFSAALINLKLEKIDEELSPWIKKFVALFKVDRGIVNEYNYDKNRIDVIATYTDPDVDVPPTAESEEVSGPVMLKLAQGSVIRMETIPPDMKTIFKEDVIRQHKTKSIVVVPLSAENQIIGNLAFATYTKEHEWSDEFVRRIRLIGEIIANAILRKRSSDALIEEIKSRHILEKKYTTIIKNASVGFTISDYDQNILDVNDEYCRMSGYTRDELTKMKISDIDFMESKEKVDDDIALTVDGGIYHHQSKHVRRDGSIFDVDVHSQYSKSEGFFFSFVRDVTELNKTRRELEERLKFEELTSEFSAALVNVKIDKAKTELDVWFKRFSELLNVDRCAIGEFANDFSTFRFVCTYTSPGLKPEPSPFPQKVSNDSFLGIERYLMSGKLIKLDNPNDRLPEDLTKWKNEILADGIKSALTLPLISGDTLLGSMFIATSTREQKWNPDLVRRLRLVAEIFANTLMRDRTNQELKKYQDHLERMVEERTVRLEEAQMELVKSERMATLGKLTATVSHELRNPLGTIKSSVYYVQKRLEGRDEKIVRAIERAERSINRCDLIIGELLNYSRMRDLILEPTQIDVFINEVLEDAEPPTGILIKKEFGSSEVIEMDRERFIQSIVNILTNAYQSIQEKGGEKPGCVTIVTRRDNEHLIVEISDDGMGFDMADKDKIFEPLYSTKTFGVGLGVPIIRQIIEQHGWNMDITGEPQKGATVSITIPL